MKAVLSFFLVQALCIHFIAEGSVEHIFVSFDGEEWVHHETPIANPGDSAQLRLSSPNSPTVKVPACALMGPLELDVWRTNDADRPLGMRWRSETCHPDTPLHSRIVSVKERRIPRLRPRWLDYTHERGEDEAVTRVKALKEKGFLAKYGLYLMIFAVVALGQGIRKGITEIREELEKEELERRGQQPMKPQVRVVVPKRKEAKARKKSKTGK